MLRTKLYYCIALFLSNKRSNTLVKSNTIITDVLIHMPITLLNKSYASQ